ncbi:hypothetical protein KDI_11710 [Dictyobacter arantiisoli]|uniref:Uncharacterized protein n=2 Tax=Dictyobacter arantiisoli TaxID=2014874 RepID=A0A5A5T8C3_9CHLR|nr:hypothetical protein KDI_11710 [Dictyobacter arantiisoli]
MLSSVLPRLDTYMQQHPEKIELGEVFMWVSEWIDKIFVTEPLDEVSAIAVVSKHALYISPFVYDLRFHQRIDQPALSKFFNALDTLAEKWQSKEEVSKLAAGSMILVQEYFILYGDGYTGVQKREIMQAQDELAKKIEKCLRG